MTESTYIYNTILSYFQTTEINFNYEWKCNNETDICLIGKVVEKVVSLQLQNTMDETDYLEPFQLEFSQDMRQLALITLLDILWKEQDGDIAPIVPLLDLLVTFNTIDHVIFLDQLWGLRVDDTMLF